MAQVKAFKLPGVLMIFPSGDHQEAHFHARRGDDWSAKVFFQRAVANMFEEINPPGARIRPADRRAIIKGVAANRAALLVEWEECQPRQRPRE